MQQGRTIVFNETGDRVAVADRIATIVREARDPGRIATAFHGEECLAATLAAIAAMDRDRLTVKPRLFVRRTGEGGTEAMRRLHRLMQNAEHGRPSLPAYAAAWLDELGLDAGHSDARTLLLTAARAEIVQGRPPRGAATDPAEPCYHNRLHFLQVFQCYCYLVQAQRELQAQFTCAPDPLLRAGLDDTTILRGMCAAMGHDLDHSGRGNPKNAAQAPIRFFNEDASVEVMAPLIDTTHAPGDADAARAAIRTHVRFTDPGAPRCCDLYGMLDTVRHGGLPAPNADYDPPGDHAFWACTAMLADADILYSAAGLRGNRIVGRKLTEEARRASLIMDFTTVTARKYFLDVIVGKDNLQSGPARILFNPGCEKLRRLTEQELAQRVR